MGSQEGLEQAFLPQYGLLFDEQAINVTGTFVSGDSIDIPEEHEDFALLLDMMVTGTPTSVRFDVEFTHDGGAHWFAPGVDFWQDLVYTDDVIGAGLAEWLTGGKIPGNAVRLRALAVGANAANHFIANAWIKTW